MMKDDGPITKAEFIRQMQKKVAVTAVGPSTVRGQPSGTIARVRSFLGRLRLASMPTGDAKAFAAWLDRQTKRMGGRWGVARKCLNLFLRDAVYNRFLSRAFSLQPAERLLEVPLDGVVGRYLCEHPLSEGRLPAWGSLKGLTLSEHRLFQDVAAKVAKARRIARFHLDIFIWTDNR